MNEFESILQHPTEAKADPGDYTDEDGLLYCGSIPLSRLEWT